MTDRAGFRSGDTLSALYGAAAALTRDERGDAELLVDHLLESADVHAVLLAASFATLERLEVAVSGSSAPWRGDLGTFAAELLRLAACAGFGSREAVHAAAWRLDGVRLGDGAAASEAIVVSRARIPDADLVAGAVAVLSVMVAIAAERTGEPVPASAQHLCLAAQLAAG